MASSWNNYYAKLVSDGHKTFDHVASTMKDLGEATARVIGDEKKADEMVEACGDEGVPLGVLLPGRGRSVKALHSCFVYEGKIWGLLGLKGTASLQELPLTKMKEGIYLGNQTTPTKEDMEACDDPGAFKDLEGGELGEQSSRQRSERNPPMFLITMAFFSKFVTQDEIPAKELA